MQAKHGRAGKHKRYQRAAVLALTVLLIILLAGRVLPVCAGKNVPAGASLKQAKPGQTLCFPLETAAWRVSDPYGWRKDPFTGEKAFHRGVDLACEEGTPVLAALDGVVTAARRGTAYGNYVRLTHGDGQETLYGPHAVSLCPGRGGGCSGPAAGHCRTDGPCHRGTPAL